MARVTRPVEGKALTVSYKKKVHLYLREADATEAAELLRGDHQRTVQNLKFNDLSIRKGRAPGNPAEAGAPCLSLSLHPIEWRS